MKWSCPFIFNDPFDSQIKLIVEDITDPVILKACQLYNQLNSTFASLDPEKKYEFMAKRLSTALNILPHFQELLQTNLQQSIILCLSEKFDDLLMWSHYANQHTGVVLEMQAKSELSFLHHARKVDYTNTLPIFTYDLLIYPPNNDYTADKLTDLYTLTKSRHWGYEKEWRILGEPRNYESLFEMIEYSYNEITAIYLGCRMSQDRRNTILSVIKKYCPNADIFLASKHETMFALTFSKVDYVEGQF